MFVDFRHRLIRKYYRVKTIIPLSVTTFLFMLGWGLIGPFFSIHINSILKDAFLVGLFISVWGFVRIFSDIFIGGLTDYFENKDLVTFSIIGYIFIGLGYFLIKDPILFFVLRFFHAIFGSIFWVSTWAYIHKSVNKNYREENITINQIFRTFPYLIAPFFGAFIVNILDTSYLFISISIFSTIGLIYWIIKGKNVTIREEENLRKLFKEEFKLLKKKSEEIKELALFFIPTFSISAAYAIFLPIYLITTLKFTTTQIVIISLVQFLPILFLFQVGRLADLKGRKKVLQISFLLASASLFLVYLSTEFLHFVISSFFLGVSFAIISPTLNSLVGDFCKKGEEGEMTGVSETLKDAGSIIGPLFCGFLLKFVDFRLMLLGIALFSLAIQLSVKRLK